MALSKVHNQNMKGQAKLEQNECESEKRYLAIQAKGYENLMKVDCRVAVWVGQFVHLLCTSSSMFPKITVNHTWGKMLVGCGPMRTPPEYLGLTCLRGLTRIQSLASTSIFTSTG
eukprot:scaffold24642_cov68-Cyclotella_meneghiniana.AAC.1